MLDKMGELIKEFICRVDPNHVGSFIANAVELFISLVLFGLTIRLFWKTKKMQKEIKRLHPDEYDN